MNHLFIPYELALLAKQKGFNEECFRYYHTDKSLRTISDGYLNEVCVAPLYQQIVDWLRVTYSIDILLNKEFGEYVFETWFGGEYKKAVNKNYYHALTQAIENAFKLIEEDENYTV